MHRAEINSAVSRLLFAPRYAYAEHKFLFAPFNTLLCVTPVAAAAEAKY